MCSRLEEEESVIIDKNNSEPHPRRRTYEETFDASRVKIKDARKRNLLNQKQRFESLPEEERLRLRSERNLREDNIKLRMSRLMETYAEAHLHPNINVCISLSFDSEHSDRERRSLLKQLCSSYNMVRNCERDPPRLYLSGLQCTSNQERSGVLRDSLLAQGIGYWNVKLLPQSIWDIPAECARLRSLPVLTSEIPLANQDSDHFGSYVDDELCSPFKNFIQPHELVGNQVLHSLSNFVVLSPDATEVLQEFRADKVSVVCSQ